MAALLPLLTPHERAELDALLAYEAPAPLTAEEFERWLGENSPKKYTWDRAYQRYLYQHLEKFDRREIDRLMVSMPPRHMKSETVTIMHTACLLIRQPSLRIVVGCYNQVFANKFSRRIRRLVSQHIPLSQDSQAVENWETTEGGGLRVVGVSGGITGQGFDVLIIDDPIKSREEADSETYRERLYDWYRDDLTTRMEPGAAIVLIMTRWHEDDIAGRILKSEEADEWTVINLPALAEENDPLGRQIGEALCPDRYNESDLKRRLRVMGRRGFDALYQGRPSAAEGNLFKRQWWRFWYPADKVPPAPVTVRLDDGTLYSCPQEPLPVTFEEMLQSWDCAFKDLATSDYVAGGAWGRVGSRKYLLDQVRDRLDSVATCKAIIAMSVQHPQATAKLIEDKANGPAVISLLQRRIDGIIPVNPQGGKDSRAAAVAPTVEAGNVYLPHPQVCPWVEAFIEECASFPNGAHDDQVDQMSQALTRFLQREINMGLYEELEKELTEPVETAQDVMAKMKAPQKLTERSEDGWLVDDDDEDDGRWR